MVDKVTQRELSRLNPRATREIAKILATFSGGQLNIRAVPNGFMELTATWAVLNVGDVSGLVGLRFNLQVDSFFGDVSQLIVEADGFLAGALSNVAVVEGNFPLNIPAGMTDTLRLKVTIPTNEMVGRQGSVQGFNWWIAESIVRDQQTGLNVGGDSRGEIRDWFKIEPLTSAFDVSGNPTWFVRQVTFG